MNPNALRRTSGRWLGKQPGAESRPLRQVTDSSKTWCARRRHTGLGESLADVMVSRRRSCKNLTPPRSCRHE